jgi:hypothetical protein
VKDDRRQACLKEIKLRAAARLPFDPFGLRDLAKPDRRVDSIGLFEILEEV